MPRIVRTRPGRALVRHRSGRSRLHQSFSTGERTSRGVLLALSITVVSTLLAALAVFLTLSRPAGTAEIRPTLPAPVTVSLLAPPPEPP